MHLNRIHSFFLQDATGVIAIDRRTAGETGAASQADLGRIQRFYQPIAGDMQAVLDDASALHLDQCPAFIGL